LYPRQLFELFILFYLKATILELVDSEIRASRMVEYQLAKIIGKCFVYSMLLFLRSSKIKTVQVHHLIPGRNEVVKEFFL